MRELRTIDAPRTTELRSSRRLLMAALSCLVVIALPGSAVGAPEPDATWSTLAGSAPAAWHWRTVETPASGMAAGLTAVASEPGGRVAIGDLEGVSLRRGAEPFRFAARVAGVTDLRFDANGDSNVDAGADLQMQPGRAGLWIASLSGLFQLLPDGRLVDRSPAPGERARAAHRVDVADGLVLVATEAGAYVSVGEGPWRRVAEGLPAGPVIAAAIRRTGLAAGDGGLPGPGLELWLVAAESLWRLEVRMDADELTLAPARRVRIADAPAAIGPIDVATDLAGTTIVVAYPKLLALSATSGEDRRGWAAGGWQIGRPVLPPGALPSRILLRRGRLWLATDQGLLEAPSLEGPWHRSSAPAGATPTWALALDAGGDGVLAAGRRGLLRGTPVMRASGESAPPSERRLRVPADPDILEVQRAGLRYVDLDPKKFHALRRGLARRGWLPTVSLRLAASSLSQRQRDYDEAYLSGGMRRLHDRTKDDDLDLDASLVLSWDLGDLAFDDSAIDLSREARQVISLRDSVLDEINQIYFERRDVLERLAAGPGPEAADQRALELRASQLAAGLDAWTGGWFSRVRAGRRDLSDPEAGDHTRVPVGTGSPQRSLLRSRNHLAPRPGSG